jgi:Ca2+-binding EF-hand superfamily protein
MRCFDICDKNHDGIIGISEMEVCLNRQHASMAAKWTTQEVADLVRTADGNKDGYLDIIECSQSHHILTEIPGMDAGEAHLEL